MSSAIADADATQTGEAKSDAQDQNTAATPTPDGAEAKPEAGQEQSQKAATLLTDPVKPEPLVVTPPEGYDPTVTERVTAIAQELGLTDAKHAQRIVDALAGEARTAVDAFKASIVPGGAEWTAMVKGLEAQALADKEIGGTPEQLTRSVAEAKRVVDQYASPDFKVFLEASGYGSHPEFIRFLKNIAKATGEDKLIQGEPSKAKPKSRAGRVFPDLPDEGI